MRTEVQAISSIRRGRALSGRVARPAGLTAGGKMGGTAENFVPGIIYIVPGIFAYAQWRITQSGTAISVWMEYYAKYISIKEGRADERKIGTD